MDIQQRLQQLRSLIEQELTDIKTDWYDENDIPWSSDEEAHLADEAFYASAEGAEMIIFVHGIGRTYSEEQFAWAYLQTNNTGVTRKDCDA